MAVTPLTLDEMVTDLRAEIGHSLAITHGVNEEATLKHYLVRTQRELYASYDWPNLITDTVTSAAGARNMAIPTGVSYEQINEVWAFLSGHWRQLSYGIDPGHYNISNPDTTKGQPQRYRAWSTATQIELWPVPTTATLKLLFRAQKNLSPLVDGSDLSTLDGLLIVMFAAADYCARQKDEDAGLKLSKAQAYLNNVRKQITSHKSRITSMTPRAHNLARPGLDYIPMGGA